MNKRVIILSLVVSISLQIYACRFTVREIGFSTLSQDFFSLVIIDSSLSQDDQVYIRIRELFKKSNIRLLVLHPAVDQSHPAFLAARKANFSFPSRFLYSPDGRTLLLGDSNLEELADSVLHSPLRKYLSQNFYTRFAFVLFIEGTNSEHNILADNILKVNCFKLTNRMPNMPRLVANGPEVLRISRGDFQKERILLWTLGIEHIPPSPQALVIYGRGRIIGSVTDYPDIINDQVFRRLAMIGADCECGLDRKWMLGDQIPLQWTSANSQQLADELGFDVDNPIILAEMSHILSKDQISDFNSALTFAPEEFDLDSLFSSSGDQQENEETSGRKSPNPFLFILIISVLILLSGLFIFLRRNK
jgi:hypothetical protein